MKTNETHYNFAPKLEGHFYLHINGNMIYKPLLSTSRADLDESTLVAHYWPFQEDSRVLAWLIATEALALGAREEEIHDLQEKWHLSDNDAAVFALHYGLNIFRDGDQFCATFMDFKNIQESQCGFGSTALEALSNLYKESL